MSEHVTTDPLPEQTALMAARVKRMMLIAGLTTALGIGAVFVAIGYKLFRGDGTAAADATLLLPKGARIVATAPLGDRIAVTLDVGGTTEIRTYDAKTFKMLGRARFATEP
ncbi:MAG: hypothetical protein K2W78_03380 [Xanthobacteraceae bacterium]|nr:hypothetical protein [Xanthobacteraceae bacterium]